MAELRIPDQSNRQDDIERVGIHANFGLLMSLAILEGRVSQDGDFQDGSNTERVFKTCLRICGIEAPPFLVAEDVPNLTDRAFSEYDVTPIAAAERFRRYADIMLFGNDLYIQEDQGVQCIIDQLVLDARLMSGKAYDSIAMSGNILPACIPDGEGCTVEFSSLNVMARDLIRGN